MASRSWWLACQMIRFSGGGNYTLSNLWDGMTTNNALSNTGVETSSKTWDGCCSSQPTLSIFFMPLSAAFTAICHQNASIPKCKLRARSGRHRYAETLRDDNVVINIKSMLRVEETLEPLSSCPTEHISEILLATRKSDLYIRQLAINLRWSARCPQCTAFKLSLSSRFQSITAIFPRSSLMSSGNETKRCWTKYSGGYSRLSPFNTIPAPRAGFTTFSLQMATSGFANQF